MQRKIVLPLLTCIVLLACTFGSPSIVIPATVIPTENIIPSTEVPAETVRATTSFVAVRLYPHDGDLMVQLAAEAQKATTLGMKAYVEFDATW